MTSHAPARERARMRPTRAALILVLALVLLAGGTVIHQSASPFAQSVEETLLGVHGDTSDADDPVLPHHDGVVDARDGLLPDGVTAFDARHPGVANLDPALLQALRAASVDAAADGVVLLINSGWRSAEYQDQLRREAIVQHGSAEEAARWVAPDTSTHLSGDAVDVGHADARSWLSQHGARHGLCQTYANEAWHYELRPEVDRHGCPSMYADAAHDPRINGDRGRDPTVR